MCFRVHSSGGYLDFFQKENEGEIIKRALIHEKEYMTV
jgi:hypothetical protein